MNDKRKLRLKKFYFHPITTFLIMTIIVVLLSGIFSLFEMQATYNTVNVNTKELEPTLIAVENMLSLKGIRYIISNAMTNFLSFGPLGSLIISLIALTIAESTGLLEAVTKRYISKIPRQIFTFIVLFIATASSLINDVGYAILIPLAALLYFMNNRNPMLGIVTAFCGVAFGYGVSLFVGTQEITLMEYTKNAAMLIDESTHIALTSNLIFIIAATVILSVVGTIIIEKIIAPRIGKYKREEELAQTEKYSPISMAAQEAEDELKAIEQDKNEKKGLRFALITAIIFIAVFIYSLIPGLPGSGLMLDMSEKIYVNQIFGDNSYLQDGFTYIVALFFATTGLAYAFGAKSIKNDKDLIGKIHNNFAKLGSTFVLMFVAAQFIAIFKRTNIGEVITTWLANLLEYMEIDGVLLIIITLLLIAISNLFLTSASSKWALFSPIVVPVFMQSNISPEFAQIVMRAGDSMTKGFTPLLGAFIIYIGYLNLYNLHKEKPITIRKSLKMITPYFLLIAAVWIVLVVGWYIVGLPIGPGVSPTI